MVGGDGDGHHAKEGEVEQCEVHEEYIPQKLPHVPLERRHEVEDAAVDKGLHTDIRELHCNLHKYVLAQHSTTKMNSDERRRRRPCLGQGEWQRRIHSGSSLSIRNKSFNVYHWLHGCCVCDSYKQNSCVHRPHSVGYILLSFSVDGKINANRHKEPVLQLESMRCETDQEISSSL